MLNELSYVLELVLGALERATYEEKRSRHEFTYFNNDILVLKFPFIVQGVDPVHISINFCVLGKSYALA